MKKITTEDQKYRDYVIIRHNVEQTLRKGEKPSEIEVKLMNTKPWEVSNSESSAYDIDAPYVLLEGERNDLSISEFYIDPVINFKPMPRELYLPKWAGFMHLISSTEINGNRTKQEYAYSLLVRAVSDCRINYGINTARTFVQRLHDNRWSIGTKMSAHLFTVAAISNEEELIQLVNDKSFINECIANIRNDLNTIKQESKTLTHWVEGLYSLNPRVWELLSYLKESELDDAEKWWRFFAEVDADITPSLIMSELSVQNQFEKRKEISEWLNLYINERKLSNSYSDFKKRLEYLLNTRTTIPNFWVEAALHHYETIDDSYPNELYEIDPYRVISISILNSLASSWWDQKNIG